MTAVKDGGTWFFNCDRCSESYEAEALEFIDALAEVQMDGWTSIKVQENEWEHRCPRHKEDR